MESSDWVVYLIRCSDKSLYCGITNNLQKRLAEHDTGKGAKYTRSRRPVELVATSSKMSKSDALKFEYQVKQLPSGKKIIELIRGKGEPAMNIKKELNKVSKDMESLSRKLAKLIVDADRLKKAKAKTSKPKATKKAAKKKPVPKKVAKKAPKKSAKSRSVKTAAAKSSQVATPQPKGALVGIVMENIKSKPSVDVGTLCKETGFNPKQIHNILYKLKKEGKIESAGRGLYKAV